MLLKTCCFVKNLVADLTFGWYRLATESYFTAVTGS